MRKATNFYRVGQDPREELIRLMESFRKKFEGVSPSEYLKALWNMEPPAAGLEETDAQETEGRLRTWADLDQGA